jgi:RNA polymerase sigma-70 factor (ECF subfamily)
MCKNEYRRLGLRMQVETELDEIADGAENILERIDRESFARALSKELDRFAPELRAAFLLRYHEHLSLQEIAEVLDCPVGTVKSRLFNTARKLAGRLGEYHPNNQDIDYERIW